MKRVFILDEAEIKRAISEYVERQCGDDGTYSVSFIPSFYSDGHMEYNTARVEVRKD